MNTQHSPSSQWYFSGSAHRSQHCCRRVHSVRTPQVLPGTSTRLRAAPRTPTAGGDSDSTLGSPVAHSRRAAYTNAPVGRVSFRGNQLDYVLIGGREHSEAQRRPLIPWFGKLAYDGMQQLEDYASAPLRLCAALAAQVLHGTRMRRRDVDDSGPSWALRMRQRASPPLGPSTKLPTASLDCTQCSRRIQPNLQETACRWTGTGCRTVFSLRHQGN